MYVRMYVCIYNYGSSFMVLQYHGHIPFCGFQATVKVSCLIISITGKIPMGNREFIKIK